MMASLAFASPAAQVVVGGWGVWHDAQVESCLKLAVSIGLSPPSALTPPFWPILNSLHSLPFAWYVVPTKPPDCTCFTTLC